MVTEIQRVKLFRFLKNIMDNILKHTISEKASLREALIMINNIPATKTLFLLNDKMQVTGTLTDGDIRRGIINGMGLDASLLDYALKDFFYLEQGKYSLEDVEIIRKRMLKLVPLVNGEKRIVKLYNFKKIRALLPVDAVIMAGGIGKRLLPLTKLTPKPLLKIGTKPIIEYNTDRLAYFGIQKINITVKYLAEQLINYYNQKDSHIEYNYVHEVEPLGTMGALSLINEFKNNHILVMNSDLLTNIDYEDFYKEFLAKKADIMAASIAYDVNLPYAVFSTKNNNRVLSLKEKPSYTYYINAGIYLFKKEILQMIPRNKYYDATDLMNDAMAKGYNLIHYPIRTYWLDIGKQEDFEKAQKDIAHINWS